jgi:hypothetical protein
MSDWYSPSEFNFSYNHMKWALPEIEEMRQGRWPEMPPEYVWYLTNQSKNGNPEESTEAIERLKVITKDLTKYKGFGRPWLWEKVIEIAAEIMERIEKSGKDGMMLYDSLVLHKSNDQLHQTYNKDIEEIGDRIDRVLVYISGWNRKGDYEYWVKNRRRDGNNKAR